MKKVIIKWDRITQLCNNLYGMLSTRRMLNKDNVLYIYGVPTGGLVPATVLYNKLRANGYAADLVLDLDVLSRIHDNTCQGDTILVVDDITDSGHTFNIISEHVPEAQFAALFMRSDCKFEPNFVCEVWDGDEWLVYPWESDESQTARDGTLS